MLTKVVVFGNIQWNLRNGRPGRIPSETEQDTAEGKAGDVFQDVGVLDGFCCGFSPGKGSVPGHENAGDGDGVKIFGAKTADNDDTGIADVGFADFRGGERLGHGNGPMEVIGMGGAQAGDGAAGLSPGSGEFGMGVDYAADLWEFSIEQGMRVEVAGGAEGAFDDLAFEIGNDQVGEG